MDNVKTSINGLDELIGGGYSKNEITLITGSPGSGKTTFGMQYLVGGATDYDENGVLVSTIEKPSQIIKNMSKYTWNIEQLISDNKIRIIYANPLEYAKFEEYLENNMFKCLINNIDTIFSDVLKKIKEIDAKRVFIDSISPFKLSSNESEIKYIIYKLIENIESLNCTTLISSNIKNKNTFSIEEFVFPSVIKLHVFRAGGIKVKAIEILKMRGVKHDEVMHPYEFQDDGIIVHPKEIVMVDESKFLYSI